MSNRLLIMACSATKRPDDGYIPARDRYNGPLWQTLRCASQPVNLAVLMLSAKYGFRCADKAIALYEDRLTPQLAEAMRTGAVHDMHQPATYRPHQACAVNELRDAREQIRRSQDAPVADLFGEVCLVGGGLYLEVMRRNVPQWQRESGQRNVAPDATVTEINGPIGIMRHQLKEWLESKPS